MVAWEGRTIATTPRLVLRTFREDDLPAYAALNAHPKVVRWLGGEPLSGEHSDGIAFDAVVYSITADRWHARRSSAPS